MMITHNNYYVLHLELSSLFILGHCFSYEVTQREYSCRRCLFSIIILSVALLAIAAGLVGLALVNSIGHFAHMCTNLQYDPVAHKGDTIKAGTFTSCQSHAIAKSEDIIQFYTADCNELPLYHEPFQNSLAFVGGDNMVFPVLDSSQHSSYFADGLKSQLELNVSAIGKGKVSPSICLFTDHKKYIDFRIPSEKCKFLEVNNGTAIESFTFNDSTVGYKFIGIRVDREISSLSFNFTATRGYYNSSDFATEFQCRTSIDNQCSNISLPYTESCVMARVEPVNVNDGFYSWSLTGSKKVEVRKKGGKIALDFFLSLITAVLLLVCLLFCILSCLKCNRRVQHQHLLQNS